MQDYKKLNIWVKSIEVVKLVYRLCEMLPKNEEYGLSSQLKRSAASISSNIVEGASRTSKKDFCRFLEISLGSAFELETQLVITKELELGNKSDTQHLINEVSSLKKMIFAFIQKLKT